MKIIALFVLAEILDCITTVIALHLGFVEANPLLPILGWGGMNVIKLLGTVLVVLFLIWTQKLLPKLGFFYGVLITIVATAPVINNIMLILGEI
jgi:hypothetical protein